MSQVPYRDKVWGWRLIIHLNVSSIIIIIRIRARYQHKHRTTQRNAPLFSSEWFSPSQLAISTGHRQWRRRRRQRQRRVSIIHSADNQKSWKHTFMRRSLVPEERRAAGQEGDGATGGCTSARREGGGTRRGERAEYDRRRCRGDEAREGEFPKSGWQA